MPVEEQGIDLIVRLLGRDDLEIIRFDSPFGRGFPEELAAIADRPVSYTLEVRCDALGAQGHYRLTLDPPRPAIEEDRWHVAALRATQEANRAFGLSEPYPRQVALRRSEIEAWRRAGDRSREAETLSLLAFVHGGKGDFAAATATHRQAAELWHRLNDVPRQVAELCEAGHAAFAEARRAAARPDWKRQVSAAQDLFLEALGAAGRKGDGNLQANVLNRLAGVHLEIGEPQEALKLYRRALDLATGDERAPALNNLGLLYQSLGEWEKAAEQFDQALALQLDDSQRARTLNNLGITLHSLGRYKEELKPLASARELGRKARDHEVESRASTNLAYAYIEMGQPAQAFELAESAIAAAGEDAALAREAHVALAYAHLEQRSHRDLAAARAELAKADALSQGPGDLAARLNATLNTTLLLARIERAEGHSEKALGTLKGGLSILESLRRRVVSPDLRSTFLASRQSFYELQVDLLMDLGLSPGGVRPKRLAEALRASEQAKARSLLDLLTQAGANVRRGADPKLLARERQLSRELGEQETRRRLLEQDEAPAAVRAAAERAVRAALDRYDRVEEELLESSSRYRSIAQPEPVTLEEIQRDLLDEDCLLLEYALGRDRSYLWAVTPHSIDAFALGPRAVLEKDATLLYKLMTERNDPGPGPPKETPAQRAERFRHADKLAAIVAARLGERLLGPAAGLLGKRRLLVVPDGALVYVPFAALRVRPPGSAAPQFLIDSHEVVGLPSASALAVLRRQVRDRPAPLGLLAAIADPVFEPDDERFARLPRTAAASPSRRAGFRRLPAPPGPPAVEPRQRLINSRKEAKKILKLVRHGRILAAFDFAASRTTVLGGKLRDYRLVHFATHGEINSRQPELSGLALSAIDWHGRAEPQGSVLRLADVYDLDLDADLVVLSACETALGREIPGEGLVGLTRGFMYAGAARVVASLWNVNDEATAELMTLFYAGILDQGLSPSAALRQAKLRLRTSENGEWASPYFWAGFPLQGEWK